MKLIKFKNVAFVAISFVSMLGVASAARAQSVAVAQCALYSVDKTSHVTHVTNNELSFEIGSTNENTAQVIGVVNGTKVKIYSPFSIASPSVALVAQSATQTVVTARELLLTPTTLTLSLRSSSGDAFSVTCSVSVAN